MKTPLLYSLFAGLVFASSASAIAPIYVNDWEDSADEDIGSWFSYGMDFSGSFGPVVVPSVTWNSGGIDVNMDASDPQLGEPPLQNWWFGGFGIGGDFGDPGRDGSDFEIPLFVTSTDQILIEFEYTLNGTVSSGDALEVQIQNNGIAARSIVSTDGDGTFTFSKLLSEFSFDAGFDITASHFLAFQVDYKGADFFGAWGTDATNTITIESMNFVAVPEPSALALLGIGSVCALILLRRRQ